MYQTHTFYLPTSATPSTASATSASSTSAPPDATSKGSAATSGGGHGKTDADENQGEVVHDLCVVTDLAWDFGPPPGEELSIEPRVLR